MFLHEDEIILTVQWADIQPNQFAKNTIEPIFLLIPEVVSLTSQKIPLAIPIQADFNNSDSP